MIHIVPTYQKGFRLLFGLAVPEGSGSDLHHHWIHTGYVGSQYASRHSMYCTYLGHRVVIYSIVEVVFRVENRFISNSCLTLHFQVVIADTGLLIFF